MAPAIKMLYTFELLALAMLEKMADQNLSSVPPRFYTMDGPGVALFGLLCIG